jgi:hypothetical protein
MDAIQLTTKNTITFKRVDTKHCTSYKIYANYLEDGEMKEYLLDEIPNPKTSSPLPKVKYFEYNKRKMWTFNERVLARSTSDVVVYVNEVRLITSQYTFAPAIGILNIHIPLSEGDVIKVEYNVDGLKYVHNTTKRHEYRIVPVFNNEYKLGDHNLL